MGFALLAGQSTYCGFRLLNCLLFNSSTTTVHHLGSGQGIPQQDNQTPVFLQLPAVTPASPMLLSLSEHRCLRAHLQVILLETRHTERHLCSWVQVATPEHCRENPLPLPVVKWLNELDLEI